MQPIEVLLVEDNPGDVYLISVALQDSSIEKHIDVVEDGEEAIRFLQRRGKYANAPAPEIVILDLNLPKVDGHQVLQYIKTSPHLRHIAVVILSTSTRDHDVALAYDNRANCYLAKPNDLDEYFEVVRQIDQYWLNYVQLC